MNHSPNTTGKYIKIKKMILKFAAALRGDLRRKRGKACNSILKTTNLEGIKKKTCIQNRVTRLAESVRVSSQIQIPSISQDTEDKIWRVTSPSAGDLKESLQRLVDNTFPLRHFSSFQAWIRFNFLDQWNVLVDVDTGALITPTYSGEGTLALILTLMLIIMIGI